MSVDMKFIAIAPTAITVLGSMVSWFAGEESFAVLILSIGGFFQILWLLLGENNRR